MNLLQSHIRHLSCSNVAPPAWETEVNETTSFVDLSVRFELCFASQCARIVIRCCACDVMYIYVLPRVKAYGTMCTRRSQFISTCTG